MNKKEAAEFAEQYKEELSGKSKDEAKEVLLADFEEKDANKILEALFPEKAGPVFAAKRFADKNTGIIYNVDDEITHLGAERHAELKKRGFIQE